MVIASPLFRGIDGDTLEEFSRIGALRTRTFEKDEVILCSGETTAEMGIVQSGSILIENIDPWGGRSILSKVGQGRVFAESYALTSSPMMVDVIADEKSTILFINTGRLLDESNREKRWYTTLLSNIVRVTAGKNMTLSERIFCTSPKGIRARILMYLTAMYKRSGSRTFSIPFDRQSMADYLNVERTALSKELGRMKREGLIDFRKNGFTLLRSPEE